MNRAFTIHDTGKTFKYRGKVYEAIAWCEKPAIIMREIEKEDSEHSVVYNCPLVEEWEEMETSDKSKPK